MSAIIAGITRHVLALLGAVWAGSDAEIGAAVRSFIEQLAQGDSSALGGSIVTLIAIGWSIFDKKKREIKKEIEQ
jgi:hypothetical protein